MHRAPVALVALGALLLAGCSDNTTQPLSVTPQQPLSGQSAQSGYYFQSASEQQLQDDTFANPGYLWIDEGQSLFQTPPLAQSQTLQPSNDATPSCANCHSNSVASDTGRDWTSAATRYPTFDARLNRVINLETRINECRVRHQSQQPLPFESRALLALSAFVANRALGQPIKAATRAEDLASSRRGAAYYQRRKGQLNLACTHCHERHPGLMLRGDRLSQGLPTGYPAYKLEWQTLGSLQRRLRDCDAGVRAERWEYGAQTYVDVERYLKDRAAGLPIETPAVRR